MQPLRKPSGENYPIHLFELDMTSAQCGYPICCPGPQPKFKPVPLFPSHVSDLGIENELKSLMKKIEEIFKKTGMPQCPCICHNLCFPCLPICLGMICASERKSGLEDAIAKFNAKVGKPIGVFVQFNQDCYNTMFGTRNRRKRKGIAGGRNDIVVLQHNQRIQNPGLEVLLNKPWRLKYCSDHNRPFTVPGPVIHLLPGMQMNLGQGYGQPQPVLQQPLQAQFHQHQMPGMVMPAR